MIKLDAAHKAALILFSVLILAYLFALPATWQEQFDYYYLELVLLAALLTLLGQAWRRTTNRSARAFFGLLGVSFAVWFVVRAVSFLFPDQTAEAFELEKDAMFLLFFSAVTATIELRFDTRSHDQWYLRRISAALGSVLMVLAVFGYFSILPLAAADRPYASPVFVHAALDGYLALRFLVVAAQASEKSWRVLYGLLGLAFLLIFWADVLLWLIRSGTLSYQPGNLINISWFLWYPFAFVATAVSPIGTQKCLDDIDTTQLFPNVNGLLFFGLLLPLIHVAGYAFDWLVVEARQSRDIFVAVWLMLIAVMFVGLYRFIHSRVVSLEKKRGLAEIKADQFEEQLNRELRIRSLGRLSSGLAHDFGNTLNALEMYAVAAQRRVERSERSTSEFDGVKKSILYAKNMVAQLKLFGAADERVEAEALDLNAETQKALELITPSLNSETGLKFRPMVVEIYVLAEKSMLHRVVTNYVHNAIDAIGESGTIEVQTEIATVSTQCRSCGETVGGRYAVLSVSDSGPGVGAAIANSIFEPLVTSKPLGLGSGLGLSSVHGIMHKIGGHVGLSKSSDGGACFIAYFALAGQDSAVKSD